MPDKRPDINFSISISRIMEQKKNEPTSQEIPLILDQILEHHQTEPIKQCLSDYYYQHSICYVSIVVILNGIFK